MLAVAGAALCGIVLVMATLASVSDRSRASSSENPPLGPFRPHAKTSISRETHYERDLLRRLTEAPSSGGGQLLGLTFDPRAATARLRIFIPASLRKGVLTPEYRARILREAYRFAYLAHQADHTITTVEVFAVGPEPAGGDENGLLMAGSVATKDLWQNPDAVSPDQLGSTFSAAGAPWWSRDLQGL